MDDAEKRKVEQLARERVELAFGHARVDEQTAQEVNDLLEKTPASELFDADEMFQAGQIAVAGNVEQTGVRMTNDVEEYHKAWQEYYHKYYQYHFGQEMEKKDAAHQAEVQELLQQEDAIDQNARLMKRLRQQVRQTTRERVRKIRRSRHYLPLVLGAVVLLGLLFVQYNRTLRAWVTAYITPVGNASGLEMLESDDASGPAKLMIPKVNVSVPIIFGCGIDKDSQNRCMRDGVMHFAVSGANALPGENGNFALSGHSSNDAFSAGDFKFIFIQLPQMVPGDLAYVNYNNLRYTYVVDRIEIVDPEDVDALRLGNDRPRMTLITCYPIGTARQRMLIHLNQIHPAPDTATPGTELPDEGGEQAMVGVEPTLLERLWARLTGRELES